MITLSTRKKQWPAALKVNNTGKVPSLIMKGAKKSWTLLAQRANAFSNCIIKVLTRRALHFMWRWKSLADSLKLRPFMDQVSPNGTTDTQLSSI